MGGAVVSGHDSAKRVSDEFGDFRRRATAPSRSEALADILARVSREALEGDDLDAVLQGIVSCLIRHLPVTVASIILLNDEHTHFVQEVHAGSFALDMPAALPWPVTLGAAGRCARTGRAQLIADIERDPDYVPGNGAVRAEYLVPIRHRDRMHGVLNLESTQADFFTGEVCALFDAVADQIAGAIHLARIVRELKAANKKLSRLSLIDGLTGVANRRSFDQHLAEHWRDLADNAQLLSLLFIDADCFKSLNDACGHLYGDECLRELARQCERSADGCEDVVARYGGDELAILLPRRDLHAAHGIAEHLRYAVEQKNMRHPSSHVAPKVTVSIGIGAVRPTVVQSPDVLVATADRALYAAKARGRNCVVGIEA